MPKHILRLSVLLVTLAALGYVTVRAATADSFFRFGHYRGNAVAEIAADKPKFQTQASCQPCHAKQYGEWSASVHNKADVGKGVKCQVCHGAAAGRDERGPFEHASSGPEHPKNFKLFVASDTAAQCTWCHERMPGRPAEQKQIDVATHAGAEQCTTCHNPHSPRSFVTAAARTVAGDAAAGKAKAVVCAGCHGERGVSRNLPGPSLAGQHPSYLIAALGEYRAGVRDNPLMSPMAKDLSDADISNLAAYFSEQRCRSARPAAAGDRSLAVKCANCHGAKGLSPQPNWPNLAGQSADYLTAALAAYRSGGRKNATMASMSRSVSEAESARLASYFAASACN